MSLAARIVPCLDVKDGRVVKGVNEIGLLDISASVEGRGALIEAVKRTAERCFTPLTVGGGVRTPDDVQRLLAAGADKVSINTAAVVTPEVIDAASRAFGAQAIVVAIDAKATQPGRWEVFTHGGRNATGRDAIAFAEEAAERGAGELLVTSMDRDGVKSGYDLDLLAQIAEKVRVPIIASGGAGSLQHLVEAITIGRASAALAASIFHFGTHTVGEARAALAAAGVPVRTI